MRSGFSGECRHRLIALLRQRVIRICAASILTGLLTGFVGGAFRYLLLDADKLRDLMVYSAHAWPRAGWLLPVLVAALGAALARFLVVRFAPNAAGSGIQHVEAVFRGEAKPDGAATVPVKFLGGLVALGTGMALGREGPVVQMGAALASWPSKMLAPDEEDFKIVQVAGAGAGLAVAFNAPIGGSIFVLEELTGSVSTWLLVAALAAALTATWTMRWALGNTHDFILKPVNHGWSIFPFLLLGALLGVAGAYYNRLLLVMLRLADRCTRIPSIYRAAAIGAAIGLIVWFKPMLVGDGSQMIQAIFSNHYTIEALLTIFCLRFAMGPWSYAAGAPGGLFTPILLLGASFGALFAEVLNYIVPTLGLPVAACAVVGMAALFAACVRAPLTSIVIAIEMTGRANLTLALLAGSLGAMVVAILLKSEPIYEILKRRMLREGTAP